MNEANKKIIIGLFETEKDLKQAIRIMKDRNIQVADVRTPFPVHGLDDSLGLRRSRIPIVGFIFGCTGAVLAFVFQTWVFTKDWPIVFGGKPFFAVPSFIPVIFEVTVLFSAIGMITAFIISCGLKPSGSAENIYPRVTNDRFSILIPCGKDNDENKIQSIIKDLQSCSLSDFRIQKIGER